jgi:hypothetical protein
MNLQHRTEIARPSHHRETLNGRPCGQLYYLFAGTTSEEIEERLIALDGVTSRTLFVDRNHC